MVLADNLTGTAARLWCATALGDLAAASLADGHPEGRAGALAFAAAVFDAAPAGCLEVPAQWVTSAQGPAKGHFAAVTGQLIGRLAGCGPEAWMLLCELVDGFEGSLLGLCATAAVVSTPDACITEGW